MTHDKVLLAGLAALTLASTPLWPGTTQASAATVATDAQTTRVVAAANAFLGTLTATQTKAVSFAFTDTAQRARWSNFPTGIFRRTGLRWGDLNAAQRTALTTLLGTVLSPDGLRMVQQQMNADEVLRSTDGGGGRLVFGAAEYYVSFLGTPSTTSPWTMQFGGHHLAINATVVGKDITLAPSLTGGQPIRATQNGQTVTLVQKVPQEVRDASALLQSLTTDQKARAVISTNRIDLVLGPGQDGKTLQAEGLPGSAMTATQKAQLLALIGDRLDILNADDAAPKLAAIQKNLDRTFFAWYGPTTAAGAASAYYRITGPTVVIEFSPQSMGGDPSNHLHNMYREPGNDYGAAWTK